MHFILILFKDQQECKKTKQNCILLVKINSNAKKKFTSDDYSASNTAMTLNNYNQANFFGILNSDKPENNIDRIKQILKNPLTEKINLVSI